MNGSSVTPTPGAVNPPTSSGSDCAAFEGPSRPRSSDVPSWLAWPSFGPQEDYACVTPDLGQDQASILRPDRRKAERHSDIVLQDHDRSALRLMLAQLSRCKTGVMALGRVVPGDASAFRERLIFRPACCSRACPSCDQRRRDRQRSRSEGPWRLFVTIGVPHSQWTCRDAWFQMPGWISSLMARIRDYGRRGMGGAVAVPDDDRIQHANAVRGAAPGRRAPSLIKYAWVIEPHKSGWPHLHFVSTARWIDRNWLCTVWGEIVSGVVQWCDIKKVYDVDGVCRYLSKYISKTQLSLDTLGALGAGRMWASTLPVVPIPGSGWRRDDELQRDDALYDVRHQCGSGAFDSVTPSNGKPDVYSLSRVRVSYSDLAIVLPESPSFDSSWSGFPIYGPDVQGSLRTYLNITLNLDASSGLPTGVQRSDITVSALPFSRLPASRVRTRLSPSRRRALFSRIDRLQPCDYA